MPESHWSLHSTTELIDEGVLEIGDGYRAKNNEFVPDGGLPFVRVGNISSTIETDGLDELPLDLRDVYMPKVSQTGDCLITMKGSVGRVAQVDVEKRPFVYSPQISYWRVKDEARLAPSFLRYWLQGPEFERQAFATKSATDMADYINLRDQRRMQISLPDVHIQRRIASVLSAFDEQIAINQRRIELLEDLARSLYREWFVHFRFPGHEGVERVNSELGQIPLGWSVHVLGDIADLHYGKALPAKLRRSGNVPVVSSAGVIGLHDEALVDAPGLVLGRKGNVGSVWWVDEPFFPIDTTYYVKSHLPLGLLYYQLQDVDFIDSHAAVPGLNRQQAEAVSLVVPTGKIVQVFDEISDVVHRWAAACRGAIAQLAATRDLLLPRLVSGRLDISDVDLGILTPVETE